MDRYQVENLYKVNGLGDYQLEDTNDLLKVHGINFKKIKGFTRLNYGDKELFEGFIINFMNGLGLDSRIAWIPTAINFVHDDEHLAKDTNGNYVCIKRTIELIDSNEMKSLLHSYSYKEGEGYNITKIERSEYLRVEYKHYNRNEWLHIEDVDQWY